MKGFRFLIVSLFLVFGVSGCMGDKKWYGTIETLHMTKNAKNELCFYVDDFYGSENYYLDMIDTSYDSWKIYSNDSLDNKATPKFKKRIKISSFIGIKNCIPYGTNLSSDAKYKAQSLDLNKSYSVNFFANKAGEEWSESSIMFENHFFFKHNDVTKKYDIKIQR